MRPSPSFQCFSWHYQRAGNRYYKVECLVICCFSELRELVKMHGTHEKSNEEPLSYDEVLIVKVRVKICLYRLLELTSISLSECVGDEG